MLISLQLDSEIPLYEQLRNQIVIGIATGELAAQEKLPTVRQLAEDLGINTMTVNKAYSLLKQEATSSLIGAMEQSKSAAARQPGAVSGAGGAASTDHRASYNSRDGSVPVSNTVRADFFPK